MSWRKVIFVACLLVCLTPLGSPPLALGLGLAIAFTIGKPSNWLNGRATEYLLQASIVLLGFGVDLSTLYKAGKQGLLFSVATIFGTLVLGYFVGKALGVGSRTSTLISSGTAICGGSAIGAVGPAIKAEPDEMSLSLGTVFVLNAVALVLFPVIGHALKLSQGQFGVWAAIAIHDTSSVVGAANSYGTEALAIATTVKLARALWIAPVALIFAYLYRPKAKVDEQMPGLNEAPDLTDHGSPNASKPRSFIPWFIFLFIGAAAIRTFAPNTIEPSLWEAFVNLAKAGMIVTLFFIGASLSRETLKKFGYWALLEGVILWVVISCVSLFAVMRLL